MKKPCPKCGMTLRIITQYPTTAWIKGKRRATLRTLWACDRCGARINNL